MISTRACAPVGEKSKLVNIRGSPISVTRRLSTSITASWPVACHSRSSSSYGFSMRLAYVRSMFSPSSVTFTFGPWGTRLSTGRGDRPSGTRTVAISSLPLVHSKPVTIVASTGRRVT